MEGMEKVGLFNGMRRDERGATAIEYGLIAALISVFLVAAFNRLGFNLAGIFETIARALGGGG